MEEESGAKITSVGQISVPVRELESAVAFYRDRLGLRLLMEVPGAAFFECGGVRLMLSRPESPEFDHPASIVYYRVDDLEASYRALLGRGVEFVREPSIIARLPDHELWMAFLRDPAGNMLALMSEVR